MTSLIQNSKILVYYILLYDLFVYYIPFQLHSFQILDLQKRLLSARRINQQPPVNTWVQLGKSLNFSLYASIKMANDVNNKPNLTHPLANAPPKITSKPTTADTSHLNQSNPMPTDETTTTTNGYQPMPA